MGFTLGISIEKTTYYPGEAIVGTVRIVNNGTRVASIIGLTLKCEGYAHTHFGDCGKSLGTETDFTSSICKRYDWTCSENYINFFVPLTNGTNDCALAPREECQYQFNFALPSKLPPSFEASHGHVQYLLTATARRAVFKKDVKVKCLFNVSTVCDYNRDREVKLPVTCTKTKTLGWLCWKSGPVTVSAWLDRKAYIPGEVIRLYCWIDNGSGLELNTCSASLIQSTTFHGDGVNEIRERKLDRQVKLRRLRMNETLSFSLVVPYVTPTRALEVCHIMDIEYYIVIRIKTPNFYPDFKLCMDVLIGNVPITGVDTVVANPAEASIQTPNTLRPLSNAAQNDEGLPTYEQCVYPAEDTYN